MGRRRVWRNGGELGAGWRAVFGLLATCLAFLAVTAYAAPAAEPSAPGWTTPAPLTVDTTPSLQSEPALALAGAHSLVGWTDSRHAAPDLYAAFWDGASLRAEGRVTNLTPHFDMQPASGPALVVEANGRAFAVFAGEQRIYLVRYDPATGLWGAPVPVSDDPTAWYTGTRYPQLVTDGAGRLIVVWEDDRNVNPEDDWADSRGSDIYAARCDGDAMTCSANVKLNDDATRGDQRRPRLSQRGAALAVVWEDHRDHGAEAPQVYAVTSSDGGATWSSNRRVTAAAVGRLDSATHPAVAFTPSGELFAVWAHHIGASTAPADIYAARWTGAAWGAPQRVDNAPPRVRALAPVMAASDAGLFVAWQDYRAGSRNPDVYAARWNGAAWQEQAVTIDAGMQTLPALAAAGAQVRIAWQDSRRGNQDIFTAAWQGDAWTDAVQMNTDAARAPSQMAPALASFGGATYALFLGNQKGYDELWATMLPLGAATWTPPARLPTWANVGGGIAAQGAQLAVDGAGQLHAVWSEYLWPYGRHISYSSAQGGQWRDPVRVSGEDDDGFERLAPVVAARNGVIAVAWSQSNNQGTVQLYVSLHDGNGWSTPSPVLPAPMPNRWLLPMTITLTDSRVLVAWGEAEENGRGRVVVARRSVQGGGWSYAQASPPPASDWCFHHDPHLQSDTAGVVHLAWSGCALRNPPAEWPHDSVIYYARSTDGGATFSAAVRVGLTVAPDDEEYHNNTDSRPALAPGAPGEVMVVYPSRIEGRWRFYGTRLVNGVVIETQRLGDLTGDWTPAGEYGGRWYSGDSPAAVSYDAARQRFVTAFVDRRSVGGPSIFAATHGGVDLVLSQWLYLPAVRK